MMNARRLILTTLATLCGAAGVLAFAGAPARAATTHNFVGSFGPGGPGSGAFGGDAHGVAVDQSTGDVYVYDTSAEFKLFVYKFNAAGEPENFSALGTNVIEGSGESYPEAAQIAVDSSSGDIYVTEGEHVTVYGEDGSPLGELNGEVEAEYGGHWGFPCGVAVDPGGNVYVGIAYGEGGGGYVDKYTPSGSPVSANGDYVSSLVGLGEEESCNLAADSEEDVYVAPFLFAASGGVTEYDALQFHAPGEEAPAFGTLIDSNPAGASLAVDPSSGDVYIDEQADVAEYDPSTTPARRVSSFGSLSESFGVAVDHENGEVYVAAAGEGGEVDIYGPALVLPEVSVVAPVSFSSGLHGTSVTLNGTVNPEGTSVTACVFEYGTTTNYGQSVPCVPAASPANPLTGNSAIEVSAEVAGLQSGTTYYFRLTATNASGTEEAAETFETPGPRIDAESVAIVSSTSVELQAQIDPLGADTSYYFQYGTASCAASPSPCTDVPVPPGVDIGNGTTDQGVAQQVQGFAPGTYHYRVIAVQGSEAFPGVEHTFTTLPTAVAGLPDGRAWELVSPANKTGSQPGVIAKEGDLVQASANGDAIAYTANGPFAAEAQLEGSRSPEDTQILSARGARGWASQDLVTANSTGKGITDGERREYQFFSSDLALALVQPFPGGSERFGALAEPPLSPALSPGEVQEKTIYLRDDAPLAPEAAEAESYEVAQHNGELMQNPGFLALVTEKNEPGGEAFGGALVNGNYGGLEFQGATPDLGHVVFNSHRAAPGLYEWGAGGTVPQPVSVLPGQTSVTAGGALGGPEDHDARHAISDDGRLVFWTYGAGNETHLYVRDMQTGESLQIDALRGGSGLGEVKAAFQTASANGARVFFTDTQRLTADSKAAPKSGDLYVVELSGGTVAGGAPLTSTLTDLTPEGISGESAAVVAGSDGGGVLGASEDGSYVYFVAEGTLAPGAPATSGHCLEAGSPSGSTCDLYVRHYAGTGWAPTRFIATLSYEDLPDWDAGENGELKGMTSRVSPDGEYLAFMSDRSLTGYDNLDVNEATVDGKTGPHADEEVFLYDAKRESVVCASCNPSGARPAGVFDGGNELGEQLLVDNPETWNPGHGNQQVDSWLAGSVPGWTSISADNALYQSRYLSNSGRLFFNSPDRLVPAAASVMERVYEYEPNNVGGCESQAGCVGLISSPSAESESAFLDASENGNDVFFLTTERLVPQDIDSLGDVYDAHVCEPSSPCLSASTGVSSPPCEETPGLPCKAPPQSLAPAFSLPASTGSSGSGNLPPLVSKPVVKAKAKPLTRAQKLAKALKGCGKLKRKHRRVMCKKQARKRYGPKRKAKQHKAGKSSSGQGRRG